jgi:flagellar biosynthesis protein FlhA
LFCPACVSRDNLQLGANDYCIKIKELVAGRGSVRPGMVMVMDPQGQKIALAGEETTEPTFGLPAMWVLGKPAGGGAVQGLYRGGLHRLLTHHPV